jgi:hypothetical protein
MSFIGAFALIQLIGSFEGALTFFFVAAGASFGGVLLFIVKLFNLKICQQLEV